MADAADICRKLIALATNNPSPEEAKLAALKACQLIMENNITVGQQQAGSRPRGYEPLSPEEEVQVADFFTKATSQAQVDPDHKAIQYRAPDPDIDDGFMKRRILEGWRKLREERAKFGTEVYNWEKVSRRVYNWVHDVNRPGRV